MKKNSWAFKINFVFAAPLLAYSGFGIYWIEFYQYQLNPDGVSYLSIAQKYVHGDFADAINGYWGPLYSWLLTPLLAVGTFPLLAAKIGSLAIGLVTLIGLRFLSYRFEMSEMTRNVLLFAMIPILVAFAFSTITADLLLVGVLVYYLAIYLIRVIKRPATKVSCAAPWAASRIWPRVMVFHFFSRIF